MLAALLLLAPPLAGAAAQQPAPPATTASPAAPEMPPLPSLEGPQGEVISHGAVSAPGHQHRELPETAPAKSSAAAKSITAAKSTTASKSTVAAKPARSRGKTAGKAKPKSAAVRSGNGKARAAHAAARRVAPRRKR